MSRILQTHQHTPHKLITVVRVCVRGMVGRWVGGGRRVRVSKNKKQHEKHKKTRNIEKNHEICLNASFCTHTYPAHPSHTPDMSAMVVRVRV